MSNYSWRNDYKENAGFMGIAAQWWVLIVVLTILTAVAFLAFRPVELGFERQQNQQSQQYEATQIAAMRTNFDTVVALDREIAQYQAQPQSSERDRLIQADVSSRQAALNDIKRARDLAPNKDMVPADISAYLSRTGN
jgi:preprotein translocase subunit SecF